ncbi:MAG: glycosyltransferase [Rhodospirillales bacterium]|nr:glycosyltransferase [Alphaproteobacteria bacterium]MCB9977248.1 glycosyltransferase [Rhodospirillales bacterium]
MKVLQVLAGAQEGGAETAFVDTCLALAKAGLLIEAVIRPHEARRARLSAAGIKVHVLPFGGTLDLWTPYRMRSIIHDFQPVIVQTWMSRASDKTPAWSSSLRAPRYALLARLGGYYNLKYYRHTDYFLANTPDIRQYLLDKGIPPEKVRHINNFADFDDGPGVVSRSDFDTPEDAPLLLALGRLHVNKAFDVLIKAVAQVPDAYLWIAGEGPERGALESLISSLKLRKRVKLLGWRDDRGPLFRTADICVFPSRFEAFGNVFAQAWAQKIPLITTDSTGPKQFVRDREDALLTPIDDVGAMAACIRRFIDDREFAQALAARGYQRFKEEFSREKTVQAYLDYYSCIEQHLSGGSLRAEQA